MVQTWVDLTISDRVIARVLIDTHPGEPKAQLERRAMNELRRAVRMKETLIPWLLFMGCLVGPQ
jgi:hypothetical protein